MKTIRSAAALLALTLALGAPELASSRAVSHPAKVGVGADWTTHGGDSNETDFSRLDQINTRNVGKLGLAWAMELDGEVTLEATPLAVDGVLYFTGSYGAVYAVDATSGKLLWKYDPKTWEFNPEKMMYNFAVNRGVAYADGRIFAAALDGRLTALDAKTGQVQWTTETVPHHGYYTVTGAPRAFGGKVIIGNAGADSFLRGYVTAYDQKTGKQVWRFYTAPGSPEENKGDPAMEKAAATWGGKFWKSGTGGAVWNAITYDADLNRIYLGTANAAPYNPRIRSPGGGDNLYTASIVALDADTGKYVWHYQDNPMDAWDYDATAQIQLADLTIKGKRRKVLMQAPKNGFFYVIDRATGKLISAEKIGKVTWADRIDLKTGRPVERPNIRYEHGDSLLYPSGVGAHNWQDMAFNPKTRLVYIPYMQLGTRFTTNIRPGDFNLGGMTVQFVGAEPGDNHGALLAWDPVRQKARWKQPIDTIWNGGALTTAGGLVFQGTGEGHVSAYDAASGKRLWDFDAGLGIVAPPMTFSAGGKQYVSILVGYGGTTAAISDFLNAGWKFGAQPRRLLTFAIGGDQTLPPSAPRDRTVHAVDDPSLTLDPAAAKMGQGMSIACMACHGPGFRGAGSPAPDLRESQIALTEDGLWSVVHDGVLIQHGMPRFDMLTRPQVHALWTYIRSTARDALAKDKTAAAAH